MMAIYPEFFRRIDERADALFYAQPRFGTHLDAAANEQVATLYRRLLPEKGCVLDLMAGHDSHIDERLEVVGLGLNATELETNPALNELCVYDLNIRERLPFNTERFDAAVCTASVQYMTRPDDTFTEVCRCLKPGSPFIVTFSNRMFPTKAVLAWRASDDAAHQRLVRSYFDLTGGFGETQTFCFIPDEGDPLYAVWAYKRGDGV